MDLLLNKMRYKALGVENDQLKAQIRDLEALRRAQDGLPSPPKRVA